MNAQNSETTNPYKGIKGGDPRLKAENLRKMVTVEFICSECSKKKTVKIFAGTTRRDKPCEECRNAEGARKAKEETERRHLRYEKMERERRRAPIRSAEERTALLEQCKDAPKHSCDTCHNEFFVFDASLPFAQDNVDKADAILTVSYCADPFDSEVYGKETMGWLCGRCYQNSAHEV